MVYQKKNTIILASVFGILFSLASCMEETKTLEDMKPYDGPAMVVDNVETLYSDSAIVRVNLKAAKQIELQNGDRNFPKGVFVQFYDERGKPSSTLTANTGKYIKDKNLYTVTGNVEIINTVKKEKLKTELLNWDPTAQKIYNDTTTFVTIHTPTEILTGKGLEAREDFSRYRLLNPVGVITVSESN